jgi:two-component system, LytTR family, sensor kinase
VSGRRSPLPGARRVLAWGLVATPVIAIVHASQVYLDSRLAGTGETFFYSWSHVLPIWATLSVGAALTVPFVRQFPLPDRRLIRSVAAHIAGGLLFPVLTLGMLDVLHTAFAGTAFVEHFRWLVGTAYLEQMAVFFAVAGGLHVVRNARERVLLREETLELRAALADARLAALSQQLRPHFLFNALNAATMLIRGGESTRAVEVLARLGGLVRLLLREPRDVVPLAEEFAFLREYLELEGVRFGDRLTVDLSLDGALEDMRVPFLLLQPLVENALRYGVACRSGASRLAVAAHRENGHLRLVVEERGGGGRAGPPEQGHGVGLANTRERLRARYGEGARLSVDVDPAGNGSRAEILVPVTH